MRKTFAHKPKRRDPRSRFFRRPTRHEVTLDVILSELDSPRLRRVIDPRTTGLIG